MNNVRHECRSSDTKPAELGCGLRRNWLFERPQVLPATLGLAALICLLLPDEMGAVLRWERHYARHYQESGRDIVQTSDGGYAAVGWAQYLWPDTNAMWLVRLDSIGDTAWTRTFLPLGASVTQGMAVVQSSDGGFALAGTFTRIPSPCTANAFVVRTNPVGKELWVRRFGGKDALAKDIVLTRDGNYVVVGRVLVGDSSALDCQGYVVRLDDRGDSIWSRCYGDIGSQEFRVIRQTADGGFILAGNSTVDLDGRAWLVRTDSQGEVRWSRIYGWPQYGQSFSDVAATVDGCFVAVGGTYAVGNGDIFLVKTDSLGDTLWMRTLGGSAYEYCSGLVLQEDGSIVLAAQTFSYGAGGSDVWLVKLSGEGTMLWARTFGGIDDDLPRAIQSTDDGGFVIVGTSFSFPNGPPRDWSSDFYVIKTDGEGSASITIPTDETCGENGGRPVVENVPVGHSAPTVRYFLPFAGFPVLEVFDASGRRERGLVVGAKASGWHEAGLPADLARGSHFVRLRVSGTSATGRILIVE